MKLIKLYLEGLLLTAKALAALALIAIFTAVMSIPIVMVAQYNFSPLWLLVYPLVIAPIVAGLDRELERNAK